MVGFIEWSLSGFSKSNGSLQMWIMNVCETMANWKNGNKTLRVFTKFTHEYWLPRNKSNFQVDPYWCSTLRCHGTQHIDMKHKDIQHKYIQHKYTQHKYTQHKDTQHKDTQNNAFSIMTLSIMTLSIRAFSIQHNDTRHNGFVRSNQHKLHKAYQHCHNAECWV